MKKYSIGKTLSIVAVIIMMPCMFGLFFGPNGEHPEIFWGAVAGMSLGIALTLTGFLIAVLPSRATSVNTKDYQTYSPDTSIDYKREIKAVSANLTVDPDPKKNQIAYVYYPNAKPFYDYDVIDSGKVYYGYVIEANHQLFQAKNVATLTCPAVVVYSTDKYFEENPLALKDIVAPMRKIQVVKNWANKILKNPTECFSSIQVPRSFTDGREIYMATVMVYRRHLPLGYLSDFMLPIVADPSSQTAAFVVDVKYWTKSLIGNFVNGCNKQ